jgi:hypothetical protein
MCCLRARLQPCRNPKPVKPPKLLKTPYLKQTKRNKKLQKLASSQTQLSIIKVGIKKKVLAHKAKNRKHRGDPSSARFLRLRWDASRTCHPERSKGPASCFPQHKIPKSRLNPCISRLYAKKGGGGGVPTERSGITSVRSPGLVRRVTNLLQRAINTPRLPRDTDLSAMMDQLMRKLDPTVFRNHLLQVFFHLHRVALFGQFQPLRKTQNMRVDDNA